MMTTAQYQMTCDPVAKQAMAFGAGYVSGTSEGLADCSICGRRASGSGAVVFLKDNKRVCPQCVSQIRTLMDSRALLPFWDQH